MGKEEAWRMFGMPIKASECQAWFEACRDDLFCSCHGDAPCRESWMTPGSIFSFPELDCTEESGECIKFSEIYDGPKDSVSRFTTLPSSTRRTRKPPTPSWVVRRWTRRSTIPTRFRRIRATRTPPPQTTSATPERAGAARHHSDFFCYIVPEHFHCSIRVTGVLPLNCYLCTLVLLLKK